MKKILFLLLLSIASYGQVSTGGETDFDYGIKNNAAQTVTVPINIVTQGTDGTYGKALPANLPISYAVIDSLKLKKDATSTALTSTATLTNNGTTFTLSAFTGVIVNNSTVPAIRTVVNFAGASNVTPLYQLTLLYVDSSGVLQQANGASADLTQLQKVNNIYVARVVFNGGFVIALNLNPTIEYGIDNRFSALGDKIRNINEGNNIGANGANLQVNKGAGTTWRLGSNFSNDRKVPDETTDIAAAPIPAGVNAVGYRNGSGGWTYESFTGSITPTFWDDGTGVKATVANNKFTNHRIYFFNATNTYIVYLGRAEYSTLAAAVLEAEKPNAIVDPATSVASLIGTISVEKSCTALNNTALAAFTQGPRMQGGASSGGTSGTQNLQSTYLNSLQPQITTSTALGAVEIKRGSASDTDDIFKGSNGAGVKTFGVTGNGALTATTDYKSSTSNLILSDTGGQIFRGVRANGWTDSQSARFFQIGAVSDNVLFTTQSANIANRMAFISTKSQFTNGSYLTLPAPVGIFEVLNSNVPVFSVSTIGVQVSGGVSATTYTGGATLTGTPTAPTATVGTNTTQIATTAFVTMADASNVKLTGDQTIVGTKTFNKTGTLTNIISNNSSTGIGISSANTVGGIGIFSSNDLSGIGIKSDNYANGEGVRSNNFSTGTGFYSLNSSTGNGIFSSNNSTGAGVYSFNNSSGIGILSNAGAASTGYVYVGQSDGANTFTVTKGGNIQANTYNGGATLTGTPTAPTATVGTNTTQIATTAFVQAANGTFVADAITNGVTTVAPSQNAVFDALSLKASDLSVLHNSGNESFSGKKSGNSGTGRQVDILSDTSGVIFASTASPATISAIRGSTSYLGTAVEASVSGAGTGKLFNGISSGAVSVFSVSDLGVTTTAGVIANGFIRLKNYTVATLPAGTQGDTAYVTDATAPTYLGTLTGGGSVVCPVFYNGTTWVSH